MKTLDIGGGELRHLITFLDPVQGSDASGSVVTYEVGIPPLIARAKIEETSATDLIRAGLDVSTVAMSITTRYDPAISSKQRILTSDCDTYIIKSKRDPLRTKTWLVLICVAISQDN